MNEGIPFGYRTWRVHPWSIWDHMGGLKQIFAPSRAKTSPNVVVNGFGEDWAG